MIVTPPSPVKSSGVMAGTVGGGPSGGGRAPRATAPSPSIPLPLRGRGEGEGGHPPPRPSLKGGGKDSGENHRGRTLPDDRRQLPYSQR